MSVTKVGSCGSCLEQDVDVRWHIGSRQWYCGTCWPRPKDVPAPETGLQGASWESGLDTRATIEKRRDNLYGLRVEDSDARPAMFRVRCPQHGWLADGLSIVEARRLRTQHSLSHHTTEIGLPQ